MANSNVLSKALNWLSNLFRTVSSPISGFDVSDVKAKQDGDNFSSLFQFQTSELKDKNGKTLTDIKGNKIELNILLKTLNAQTVLAPLFDAMNDLGLDDAEFGDKYGVAGKSDFDELMNNIISSDFSNINYNQELGAFDNKMWSWEDIRKSLSYALECETPGKDFGAIEGKNIDDCAKLISEYLRLVGIITTDTEVQIDATTLVIPILSLMKATLEEYYADAQNKYSTASTQDAAQSSPDTSTAENTTQGEPTMDTTNSNIPSNPSASKHIDVTLQKIAGTTSFNMTAIKANYNPTLVLEDMDEIISQPDFIDTLPEEPTTYSIEVDDDGFDIEPCDECIECNPCESLCEVFKAGIRAYRNLYILHWMAKGNDMMKLHLMTEEMYEELQGEIDTIGELLVEKQGTVPQLDFPCDYLPIQEYDFQTGLSQIKSLIQMYIDCIDYAYCNQDSDVQSTLDEWLRYWNKQLNYFVKGQEI